MINFEQQTLARAYRQLASEEEGFRVAIGDFMDEFFLYGITERERQELLDAPIEMPENPGRQQRGWAAFCAGAAEYLASRYGLQCPLWTLSPSYQMPEPWYLNPNASQAMRSSFQNTAPEAFRKRNVFCSNRVFSNPHPSSREPGDWEDIERKRRAMLESMQTEERVAYISQYNSYMPEALHIPL